MDDNTKVRGAGDRKYKQQDYMIVFIEMQDYSIFFLI